MKRKKNEKNCCKKKLVELFLVSKENLTTLALGSRPRQGLARVQDKREA
jgi:hypothetical protein